MENSSFCVDLQKEDTLSATLECMWSTRRSPSELWFLHMLPPPPLQPALAWKLRHLLSSLAREVDLHFHGSDESTIHRILHGWSSSTTIRSLSLDVPLTSILWNTACLPRCSQLQQLSAILHGSTALSLPCTLTHLTLSFIADPCISWVNMLAPLTCLEVVRLDFPANSTSSHSFVVAGAHWMRSCLPPYLRTLVLTMPSCPTMAELVRRGCPRIVELHIGEDQPGWWWADHHVPEPVLAHMNQR